MCYCEKHKIWFELKNDRAICPICSHESRIDLIEKWKELHSESHTAIAKGVDCLHERMSRLESRFEGTGLTTEDYKKIMLVINKLESRLEKLEGKPEPKQESGLDLTELLWEFASKYTEPLATNKTAIVIHYCQQIREHIKKEIDDKCWTMETNNIEYVRTSLVKEVIDRS